jgi:hypothetical protein
MTVTLAKNFHVPRRGRKVPSERTQKGSFARTIRSEDDPMLAWPNLPANVFENDLSAAPDGQTGNLKDGFTFQSTTKSKPEGLKPKGRL